MQQSSLIGRIVAAQNDWRVVDAAALALRVTLAIVFVAHGSQKLFGWFGGAGIDGTGQFFESVGLEPGEPLAVLAGLVELGGGLLLVAGLLTSLAALALAGDMLVAIISVNGDKGFFTETPDSGFEINLILIGLALGAALLGSGRYSVDQRLGLARRINA